MSLGKQMANIHHADDQPATSSTSYGPLAHVLRMRSKEFGPWSAGVTISQEMINQFGQLTGDNQWIHTDPEKAAARSMYGSTIAQGFFTLSLLPAFQKDELERVQRQLSGSLVHIKGSYQFKRPVAAGSTVHARGRICEARQGPHNTVFVDYEYEIAVACGKPAAIGTMVLLWTQRGM